MKILFAYLCCFILFTVFIYEGRKLNIANISTEETENVINAKSNENSNLNLKATSGLRKIQSQMEMAYQNEKYQSKLCEIDKPSIDKLKFFNMTVKRIFNSNKVVNYINDFFHQFIQNPHRAYCKEIKRFPQD